MVREIITDIESIRDRADEVDIQKEGSALRAMILDLKDTIREKKLAYLTAPQIGYNARVFCINFNGDIRSFVNPMIAHREKIQMVEEKCNSLHDRRFLFPRNVEIIVLYTTPLGDVKTQKFENGSAFVFQHCVDHLDGVFVSDVGLEIDKLYDKAPKKEKIALIKAYLESLDLKQKELEKEIEEDKDLKEISDAIRFSESVAKGETKIEKIEKEDKDGDKD